MLNRGCTTFGWRPTGALRAKVTRPTPSGSTSEVAPRSTIATPKEAVTGNLVRRCRSHRAKHRSDEWRADRQLGRDLRAVVGLSRELHTGEAADSHQNRERQRDA